MKYIVNSQFVATEPSSPVSLWMSSIMKYSTIS